MSLEPAGDDARGRSPSWRGFAPQQLTLLDCLHGAIHSGGITVFPEQLEVRLIAAARDVGLQLKAVMFLGVQGPKWVERLVALVCWQDAEYPLDAAEALLLRIKALTDRWLVWEKDSEGHDGGNG